MVPAYIASQYLGRADNGERILCYGAQSEPQVPITVCHLCGTQWRVEHDEFGFMVATDTGNVCTEFRRKWKALRRGWDEEIAKGARGVGPHDPTGEVQSVTPARSSQ
jgi:hypothetical protein